MNQKTTNTNNKPETRNLHFRVLSLSFLAFFIVLVVWAKLIPSDTEFFDNKLTTYIYNSGGSLTKTFFTQITKLANSKVIVITIIVFSLLLLRKGYKVSLWYLVVSAVGSLPLNELLKIIFKRDRPNLIQLAPASGYSFPSGHTMAVVSVIGPLIYLNSRSIKNKKLRYFINTLLIAFMLLIPISRIYIGVHFPSDVVGAYLIGLAWLFLGIAFFEEHLVDN